MHTLKQMLAEADNALERMDEATAEDHNAVQEIIDHVPRVMEEIRSHLRDLSELTHEVERQYVDRLNRLQARMADRRAMMGDAGPVAQPTEETPETKTARVLGLDKEAA